MAVVAAVVFVNAANTEGTKAAASFGRMTLDTMRADLVYVVLEDEETEVPEFGREVERVVDGNAAAALNRITKHAADRGAETLIAWRSDVILSPAWPSTAINGCAMWAGVGPISAQLRGSQFVRLPEAVMAGGFADQCKWVAGKSGGNYGRCEVLDPEAFALSLPKLREVGGFDEEIGHLEWSLRDVCLRLRHAGHRTVAGSGAYASILDSSWLSPWTPTPGAFEGRTAYYAKHEGRTAPDEQRLGVSYLVQPQSRQQLSMLSESLRSLGDLPDALHVVIVSHPLGFLDGDGPAVEKTAAGRWLSGLNRADMTGAVSAMLKWVRKTTGLEREQIGISVIEEWPDPSYLQASSAAALGDLGATWVLSMSEWDLLHPEWNREIVGRLMAHPDPLVLSYNVGIIFPYGDMDTVRIDPPFGDGGSLKGDQDGSNDWRLFRVGSGPLVADGGRLANLRLLNISNRDAAWRPPNVPVDGAVISDLTRWRETSRVGLHMLAYDGENPEDVARWLDWMHGLVDATSIAWTNDLSERSQAVASLLELFGGQLWITEDHGAERNFAGWRNTAINGLENAAPQCAWGVFIDPDEWVEHPVLDLLGFRRCVETSSRFAYLVSFQNHRGGGIATPSQCVRLHRLRHGLRMRGRVHESFGDGLARLQEVYRRRGVARAPFKLQNRASSEPGAGAEKMALYAQLIREELAENPRSCSHWIQLGWQYAAEGHHRHALECFDHAVEVSSDTTLLSWLERGMLHLRRSWADLEQAIRRLPPEHDRHEEVSRVLGFLRANVAETPAPAPGDEPEPLPPFEV